MSPQLASLIAVWRWVALPLLTVGTLVGTFIIDLHTPRGVAVWALYSISILAAKEWQGLRAIYLVSTLAIIFTLLGGWYSPAGHDAVDLINRGLAVAMITVVGWISIWLERKELAHQATEAARQEFEVRFSSILESATDGIVLANNAGNIIAWNRGATTIFGYKNHEVMGRPLTLIIPARYREAHLRGLERVRATGHSPLAGKPIELEGVKKDGTEFPLELVLSMWKSQDKPFFSGIVRDISARKRAERHLAAQYAVTRVLVESSSLQETLPRILQAVCENVGWEIGALWTVDKQAKSLRCLEIWHAPSIAAAQFESSSRGWAFPRGLGLPGRVWESEKPAWITDIMHDENFPRQGTAKKAGLHSAFAFPVIFNGEVTGVTEFYCRDIRKPEEDLLQTMGSLGSQIGQYLARRSIEAERERLLKELQEATSNIKTLSGLLPICASCKKVRDDKGYWNRIEDYVKDRTEADFTHGICPECARKVHPDWDES